MSTLRFTHIFTLLLLFFTTSTSATLSLQIAKSPSAELAQLQRRSENVLGLHRRSKPSSRHRRDTVTEDLTNSLQQALYWANISVGTPPQNLALQIDTGSSDVWVPANQAQICRSATGCPGGSFNSDNSKTFVPLSDDVFNISYVDNTGAVGTYFQDTFNFGDATLEGFTMGLGEGTESDTSINIGILGIAYNNSVANTITGNGSVYANLPVALVNEGKINTYAYSLWLNDLESYTGEVLFGGIDTRKYAGDLTIIDVYPDSITGTVTSFTVAWTSLIVTSSSGSDQLTSPEFAEPVILDSGTTLTYLPAQIAYDLFEEVGATASSQLGAIVVPCGLAEKEGNFTYQFGGSNGPSISVAVSELVLPLTGPRGGPVYYQNGQQACQFGVQATNEDTPTLFGDTFLRSAYVVYDLYNNQIALAPTKFNVTESNIVEFASLGAQIPSATEAASQTEVTQSATGIPRESASITASGSEQPTYNPTVTGFSAAAGFTVAADSGSGGKGKKSDGGVRTSGEAFGGSWSRVVVLGASMALAGVGAGVVVVL